MGMDAFGMRFVPNETIPQQRPPSQKIKEKKMGEIVAALMMLATASATAAVTFMHEHRGHTGTFHGKRRTPHQVLRSDDCERGE
ncbi:MAG TPA: hypothetical protein OIM11_08935 [Coriobacteriaceae bacterium]|nr:hypothetical protein [Coriobacteriaceae bacterium]